MLKSKWEANISKKVYKRIAEKCEIIVACQETRTDRSPIPLKGGALGMDRNVCGFTRRNTGAVFLTVTSYYCCESDLKNPSPAVSIGLGNDWENSSPENLGMHKKCRYLQEY